MTALLWLLGLVAFCCALVALGRWMPKTLAHLLLILGCLVFGFPFAWTVSTSFKEDVDVSLANGIKILPRVQETVPFYDPKEPLMAGSLNGVHVEGPVVAKESNGDLTVDVMRPMVMRGNALTAPRSQLSPLPKQAPVVRGTYKGDVIRGFVVTEFANGDRQVQILSPARWKWTRYVTENRNLQMVYRLGLRTQNYVEALGSLPPETHYGLTYFENSLILVLLNLVGIILSSSIVGYGFARLRFPYRNLLFGVMLSTLMLPSVVTMAPTFLLFRAFGWIDTLYPLWVPSFFASAFNVFLLRQFFLAIPKEYEDAALLDGCNPLRTFWSVMMPQVRPALAAVGVFTFMGTWNNFMGPLTYINTPEKMPVTYALQLFAGDHGGEPAHMMAVSVLALVPVLAVFLAAQKQLMEGITLTGLGGR